MEAADTHLMMIKNNFVPDNLRLDEQVTRRYPFAWIVVILLGSMILGTAQINQNGYWFDEIASIGFVTDSATWARIAPQQMPMYYIVLRGWIDLVGSSEVAGRALSLFFGLLTLAVAYRIVRRYVSPSVAFTTLLLLGSSAFFVRYYRELRPYTLLALTCTVSTYFFLEWSRKHRTTDALAYLVFSIAAIYSHYFAALIIAVHGLYFLLTTPLIGWRPRLRLTLTRTALITLGLFLVIALSIVPYLTSYLAGVSSVTSGGFGSLYALTPSQALQSSVSTLTNDSLAAFAILIVLAVVSRQRGLGLVLLWAFLPLGLVLFVHTYIYRMLANPRYIIFIWPPFVAIAAIGLLTLPAVARRISTVVLVCVGIVQVYNNLPGTVPGTLNNPPWREMFSTIAERTSPDSLVFVNMVNPVGIPNYREPMLYYFSRFMPSNFPKPVEIAIRPQPSVEQLEARAKDISEVWFISTDGQSDPRGDAAQRALTNEHYAACNSWTYPDQQTYLVRWDKIDGEAYQFANGLRLVRSPLNPLKEQYAPGETVDLALGLYTTSPLPIDYSLGVFLFDPAGHVVSQTDYGLAHSRSSTWAVDDRYCDVRHLKLPAISGSYTLRLTIYDSAVGKRLTVSDPLSTDNLITFGNIRVG